MVRFGNLIGFLFIVCNLQIACDSSDDNKGNPPLNLTPLETAGKDGSSAGEVPSGTPPARGNGNQEPGDQLDSDLNLLPGLQVDRDTFLKDLGFAIANKVKELLVQSQNLEQRTADFCGTLSPEAPFQAQESWKRLMLKWQELELMQVGPLAQNAKTLKVNIYAWPLASNLCKIDEESLAAFSQPNYSLPSNYNRKGLQAIEFLLFDETLEPRCSPTNPTTTQWSNLPVDDRWGARCAYLKLVVKELKENLADLSSRWGTQQDNVLSRAIGSGETEQKFLQEFFDNLFYLDIEIKNRKLGEPLGLDKRYCRTSPQPCLSQQEFPFSQISRSAITVNLKTFAELMYGPKMDSAAPRQGGFSALVRQQGALDLADQSDEIVSDLMSIAMSDSSDLEALAEQQASQPCEVNRATWVCLIQDKIRTISSQLKKEYSAILNLKVPESTQGDND